MKKSDKAKMIKILNEIIRESMNYESEEKLVSLINLSARAEVSIRKNNSNDLDALEKEISDIILKYKSNNSLIKNKSK